MERRLVCTDKEIAAGCGIDPTETSESGYLPNPAIPRAPNKDISSSESGGELNKEQICAGFPTATAEEVKP